MKSESFPCATRAGCECCEPVTDARSRSSDAMDSIHGRDAPGTDLQSFPERKIHCQYEKVVRKRGRRRRPRFTSGVHRTLAPGPSSANDLNNPVVGRSLDSTPEEHDDIMDGLQRLSSSSYTEDDSIMRPTMGTRDIGGSHQHDSQNNHFSVEPPNSLLDIGLVDPQGAARLSVPNPLLFEGVFSPRLGNSNYPPSQATNTPGRVEHWLEKTPRSSPAGSLRGLYSTVSYRNIRSNLPPECSRGQRSYPCLEPLLPYLDGILPPSDASEMLEIYFNEQRNPIFKATSPYALTHIVHPSSVLHPTSPRPTSSVLLLVMLLCVAQTADIKIFDPPGARQRIVLDLYRLALDLMEPVDLDNYFRTSDGWQFHPRGGSADKEGRSSVCHAAGSGLIPDFLGSTDVILAVVILTLVISGGHFKADCLKWWSKAIRLVRASGLSMEDDGMKAGSISGQLYNGQTSHRGWLIVKEERRRLFWLVYCLDRHLALSFNGTVNFPEGTFRVAAPLPEALWQSLENIDLNFIPAAHLGPPTKITGYGFFEYFLPLATVLGHIIDFHHMQNHPLLGQSVFPKAIHQIETLISQREQDLVELKDDLENPLPTQPVLDPFSITHPLSYGSNAAVMDSKKPLVIAYSSHMLHVFYILLHGKWDPISMIEDKDDWIMSDSFQACASHALSATAAVHQILTLDPELNFMPYLFGIYLLQGSFILLLFVDRMPELGFNKSVEEVCETIIRAHEVSVVTLDTTFQKNIRKVFRSMLHDAQRADPHFRETHKARRREILSLYRWTRTSHGLAY
ncbi:hypothetical protein AOCH_000302 [Aspergillus ochraceoroseus]|uniref:Xylanolytic transcriptional activator regulatory domain-containing protein n=1 Tax=Aspergillus ochraceoroseus TaxID=138278 RepID=A0A0F8WMF2_9EURO|nr:hypothetical protein AOCH_000302 [Aspergillus ochraceoroseus]